MLKTLQDLFAQFNGPAGAHAPPVHQEQLATAVLLVEVMRADPDTPQAETDAVLASLRSRFELSDDEMERLLELAHAEARSANDFYRFTSVINDHFSHPQKVHMVELLWQVAYADGHLDAHENHVIGKVAGLLHVTHGEYIAAKLHAKAAAGL